jgi:hypothetical protein
VEFEGMTFDQAKVEVVGQNGAGRTFNIEKPDAGHPVTEDMLGLVLLDDGEPDEDSLFSELSRVLSTVGG